MEPYFCSLDRHSGGNLKNTNNQETKLGRHITWPQFKTSTLYPYLLCPHDLRCQIAFVVPKEVCHLKIRHKRNCAKHRSCCLRYTLAYWRTRMSWWIQSSLLYSKKSSPSVISSHFYYQELQVLTGTCKLSVESTRDL